MSKRKRSGKSRSQRWFGRPKLDLDDISNRVDKLIRGGQAHEAITMLEEQLESNPRSAELHFLLGSACVETGDLWRGVASYERAAKSGRDPSYWLPLTSLYLQLGLHAHALQAFRRTLKSQMDGPMIEEAREIMASLEQDVEITARYLDLPVARTERGLRYLEEGQITLHSGDYPASITANRRAVKRLGDWPPPYNNLSLALYFDGQPEKAIAVARKVLSRYPENLQALSNAIRFLTWTGQEAEAREFWSQLREITPRETSDRLKMAEAAAILGEDERVHQLLKPLDKSGAGPEQAPGASRQTQLFLAVAEANMGQRRSAQRRLRALQNTIPWSGELLAAVQEDRPGPGWAERFPYFHSSEIIPRSKMEEFIELVERQDEMSPKQFRQQMDRFAASFPQIVLMAEKLIWEENQPEAGIAFLQTIATPAAYAALRRFGLSQAGDDETRMQALFTLQQAGEIAQDETLRLWSEGEWREVQLRQYEIYEEPDELYSPKAADLIDQGTRAFKQEKYQEAERLFKRVLELEPRAKEAYNNLAAIYSHQGETDQAKAMLEAAVEIDPTYVFPRANLALFLLNEDDVEGAKEMLKPLADVTRFHPQEMAFFSYIQARVLMYEEKYEAARKTLKAALEVHPGYEPAENLLKNLDKITPLQKTFEAFMARQRKRDQTKRERLQTKLTTSDPSLPEALGIYTKDALTGMARVVLPWGGWSGLRKAELRQEIVDGLNDRDNLADIVNDLSDEERTALRQVLKNDGTMWWEEFDERYGNDLEESPYWHFHVPETTMGRLRLRGLLVEATVDDELLIVIPAELRQTLRDVLIE